MFSDRFDFRSGKCDLKMLMQLCIIISKRRFFHLRVRLAACSVRISLIHCCCRTHFVVSLFVYLSECWRKRSCNRFSFIKLKWVKTKIKWVDERYCIFVDARHTRASHKNDINRPRDRANAILPSVTVTTKCNRFELKTAGAFCNVANIKWKIEFFVRCHFNFFKNTHKKCALCSNIQLFVRLFFDAFRELKVKLKVSRATQKFSMSEKLIKINHISCDKDDKTVCSWWRWDNKRLFNMFSSRAGDTLDERNKRRTEKSVRVF